MGTDIAALQLLQSAMRAAELRQSVYANNIANVDTPGYKRQDVAFETILNQQMDATQPVAPGTVSIPIQTGINTNWQNAVNTQPVVVQGEQTTVDNNGNNVDVDAEMSNLAMNQIRYNALIQDVTMRLGRMKSAIDGGTA